MRILVCIKRIPDPETLYFPDTPVFSSEEIGWSGAEWRMNRYDEYALEAALRLKEACGKSSITALTVGNDSDAEILRRAIGMGVDHGVHIQRITPGSASPFTIGGLIAAYTRDNLFDLILCGVLSEDLMQGLVGPIIAGLTNRPCLTSVNHLTCDAEAGLLHCYREVEGGRQEKLAVGLPALVSIQSSTDTPRYPALSKLLKANHYPFEMIPETELKPIALRQQMVTLKRPDQLRQGKILNGTEKDKARQLVHLLEIRGLC